MVRKEIQEFALAAGAFRSWMDQELPKGCENAKTGLLLLLELYSKAVCLPPGFPNDRHPEIPDVTKEQWQLIYTRCQNLPPGYYGEVFDSLKIPPEEPVVGSIADDFADIYRDVVAGLRVYEAGYIDDAANLWHESLCIHWGEHATGAIRALHWWLTRNYAM